VRKQSFLLLHSPGGSGQAVEQLPLVEVSCCSHGCFQTRKGKEWHQGHGMPVARIVCNLLLCLRKHFSKHSEKLKLFPSPWT